MNDYWSIYVLLLWFHVFFCPFISYHLLYICFWFLHSLYLMSPAFFWFPRITHYHIPNLLGGCRRMDRVIALWSKHGWGSSRILHEKFEFAEAQYKYTFLWGQQQFNSQTLFLCWLYSGMWTFPFRWVSASQTKSDSIHCMPAVDQGNCYCYCKIKMPPLPPPGAFEASTLSHWVEPRVSLTAIVQQYLLPVPLLQR